jgi:hypothetical protein
MIFIQPNNPNTSAAFVKPRSATAEADPVTASDLETPTSPLAEKETADTFTFTKKPQETETDNIISPQREEENSDSVTSRKKPEKSKASALERRKRMKALEAAENKEAKQEQADAEEIHKAKVSSAWKSIIPVIGIFPLLGAVFSSPQQLAKDRGDVKFKDRDIDEATEQEKKLKASKIKASLLTQIPQWIGTVIGLVGMVSLLKNKTQDFKLGVANFLPYLCYIPAIAVPLGYKFGEKPDDPNFNKGL